MQLGQKPTFITQSQHNFNTVLTRAGMAFDSRQYEVTQTTLGVGIRKTLGSASEDWKKLGLK